MAVVRDSAAKAAVDADDLLDTDVPAAVVCAHCGEADCAGCLQEHTKSGVVAVVPWERSAAPALGRLWTTARATTFDAERFFETLPDGPLGPAIRFAVVSEVIAAAAMALVIAAPVGLLMPEWALDLVLHRTSTFARGVVLGVPSIAALLVAAHVAHGWALDRGARRSGARRSARRAIRFGLYATGWDLVMGPVGGVVVALREGLGPALSIVTIGVGLPGRSARAFLRGCYGLSGASAQPALRTATLAAIAATLLGALAVISTFVFVLLT